MNNMGLIINDIVAKAEKKIISDCKAAGKQIQKDFTKRAQEAVDIYYSEYDPYPSYIRTNNLYSNVIDDMNMIYANDFVGGDISFSHNGMAPYEDNGNPELVVFNFMRGIHGNDSVKVGNNVINYMTSFQDGYKASVLDGFFAKRGYKVR